jgi:hypothetical protein
MPHSMHKQDGKFTKSRDWVLQEDGCPGRQQYCIRVTVPTHLTHCVHCVSKFFLQPWLICYVSMARITQLERVLGDDYLDVKIGSEL